MKKGRGLSIFGKLKTPESSNSTLSRDTPVPKGGKKGAAGGGESDKLDNIQVTAVQTLLSEAKKMDDSGPSTKHMLPILEQDDDISGNRQGGVGCVGMLVLILSIIAIIITFPFSLLICVKVVREYERAVVFRLGRVKNQEDVGPGLVLIIPCTDNYTNVDMRTIAFDVPPQEVITRDSVNITVDALIYYRIKNAYTSITKIGNPYTATALISQTMIRNIIGSKNLSSIILDRIGLCLEIKVNLDDICQQWGILIERAEIKSITLPPGLQKALTAEIEAETESKAKLRAAEGEKLASEALLQASEVMSKSPTAMQLRYLQALNKISAQKNSTIIFPVPVDLMPQMVPR